MAASSESGSSVRALVRRPSPKLAAGLVTHVERRPVDADRALAQWEGYCRALADFGWDVVEVASAPEHPDGVFVEDTAVVVGDLAVLARPGAGERRGEVASVASAFERTGWRTARITGPGTLDGGDVLRIGDTLWVGRGGRTNQAGIDQLAALVGPLGATVRPVDVTRALHLKSAVTALPDGTVIGWEPVVDEPAVFDRFLAVPEEPGAHVVVLDDTTVLAATGAPRTRELLAARGLDVVVVDISEFEKLEGCVTCLSIRLRG